MLTLIDKEVGLVDCISKRPLSTYTAVSILKNYSIQSIAEVADNIINRKLVVGRQVGENINGIGNLPNQYSFEGITQKGRDYLKMK